MLILTLVQSVQYLFNSGSSSINKPQPFRQSSLQLFYVVFSHLASLVLSVDHMFVQVEGELKSNSTLVTLH